MNLALVGLVWFCFEMCHQSTSNLSLTFHHKKKLVTFVTRKLIVQEFRSSIRCFQLLTYQTKPIMGSVVFGLMATTA